MASWSEKLNQMTQNAISKSKEMAGVAKLTLEVNNLNQSIKNIHTEVGAYVLENGLLMDDASVAEWASKVAALKADIEANTEKINDLKNVSICPGCGAEVSRSSKFCDKCGTAIVVKVTEPAGTDEVVVDASYTAAGTEDSGETEQMQEGGSETEQRQEGGSETAQGTEGSSETAQGTEDSGETVRMQEDGTGNAASETKSTQTE